MACPCHFPLWVGLLAGTAAGAWFSEYWIPIVIGSGALFLAAVYRGWRMLEACDACDAGGRRDDGDA
ncbi:MAG: hypothetical protein ACT4PT_07800 [Methanobacteriota archaeon]